MKIYINLIKLSRLQIGKVLGPICYSKMNEVIGAFCHIDWWVSINFIKLQVGKLLGHIRYSKWNEVFGALCLIYGWLCLLYVFYRWLVFFTDSFSQFIWLHLRNNWPNFCLIYQEFQLWFTPRWAKPLKPSILVVHASITVMRFLTFFSLMAPFKHLSKQKYFAKRKYIQSPSSNQTSSHFHATKVIGRIISNCYLGYPSYSLLYSYHAYALSASFFKFSYVNLCILILLHSFSSVNAQTYTTRASTRI